MPSAPHANRNGDAVEVLEPAKKKTRLSGGVRQKNEAELFGEVAESCGLSYDVLSDEELRMHGSMSDTELEAYIKVGGLCVRDSTETRDCPSLPLKFAKHQHHWGFDCKVPESVQHTEAATWIDHCRWGPSLLYVTYSMCNLHPSLLQITELFTLSWGPADSLHAVVDFELNFVQLPHTDTLLQAWASPVAMTCRICTAIQFSLLVQHNIVQY